jgi:SagB-type dehydrogenase family enzyme
MTEPSEERFTPDDVYQALERVRDRLDLERRLEFQRFDIPPECLWPASRLYHAHSALGPGWAQTMTLEEVVAHTVALDYKRYPDAERFELPLTRPLAATLESVIRRRVSERSFAAEPVPLDAVATLIRLGSGITDRSEVVPRRAAPSPGGLYAVETYPIAVRVDGLDAGVYHYSALDDDLELVQRIPGPELMEGFFPPDLYSGRPALVLTLSAVFARVQAKYLERGYRFALLEAGHIAQNWLLAATALGLSSVPMGGFWDHQFNEFMGFDPIDEAVVYSVLVGLPGTEPA